MYKISIENFTGPFDLLLRLLDQKKLDIKEISLAAVTGQFIDFIRLSRDKNNIDNLAEFLPVAANLLFLKSKAVLPNLTVLEEEKDANLLQERLERYKEIKILAEKLKIAIKNNGEMFSRCESEKIFLKFFPPKNISEKALKDIFLKVMREREEFANQPIFPEESMQLIVSIEEKISVIVNSASAGRKNFSSIIFECSKIEAAVSFLALLELIKQGAIKVFQEEDFGEIEFQANF